MPKSHSKIEKETFEEVDSIRTNSKNVELDYNKNVEIDDTLPLHK